MKQRARKFGVLSNPYQAVEPGEEFDYHEAMNWADPVEDEPEPEPAPWPKPETAKHKKGSKAKADPPEII